MNSTFTLADLCFAMTTVAMERNTFFFLYRTFIVLLRVFYFIVFLSVDFIKALRSLDDMRTINLIQLRSIDKIDKLISRCSNSLLLQSIHNSFEALDIRSKLHPRPVYYSVYLNLSTRC